MESRRARDRRRHPPGGDLQAHVGGEPEACLQLTVTEFRPPQTMVWADGMPLGLFKGIRTYRLTPMRNGGTDFSMEEVFTGVLAPLITRAIPDMTRSFEQFADGLKAAAEGR